MKIFRLLSFAFTTALLASTPAFALDTHPTTVAMSKHHHHKHHRKPCRDARGRFTKC